MNCPNCGYVLNPGKSCRRKTKYQSFQSAEKDLINMSKTFAGQLGKFDGLRPYKCNFCGGYHLGHKPQLVKEKLL